ncbi:MAG: bifunctional nuclease family protein [Deltaproteobacteria bacterium]|nr:bifunctional nuclease family protein [Deltaproteobacteria bacterium]
MIIDDKDNKIEGQNELVAMKVTGLTIDPFTSMPIIILKDFEDKCALPIWIGLIEASSIATELENIQLARPMTHDLLKSIFDELGVKVQKISVVDLEDNTFYAEIALANGNKHWVIDARPSDAIAIALRMHAPIFVTKKVIEKSRKIDLSQESTSDDQVKKQKWTEILENLSPEDFGKYKM